MRSPSAINARPDIHHQGLRQEKTLGLESLDLPTSLPDLIRDDIVTYDIRTSYENLQLERERRLRLLIRRYVNQIQFGCRNPNCSIPTCLSYRKRNAKVPLRRYTELSARTLACRLVDEFSRQGKDSALGLCPSEPLVPWYEDPVSARRRRSTIGGTREKSSGSQDKSQLSRRDILETNEHAPSISTHSGPDKYLQQPGQVSSNQAANESGGRSLPSTTCVPSKSRKTSPVREDRHFSQHETPRTDGISQNGGIIYQYQDVVPPAQKKDTASFTQSIWDTLPLRRLGSLFTIWLPSESEEISPDTAATKQVEVGLSKSPNRLDPPYSGPKGELGTSFQGLTLHRLSWDTLKWITELKEESQQPWSTPFEKFIKQSVFFTLSDPTRLLESARLWNQSETSASYCSPALRDLVNTRRDTSLEELPPRQGEGRLQVSTSSTKTEKSTQDSSRVMFSFDMLFHLSSKSEVFNALHSALQQCYAITTQPRVNHSNNVLTNHINLSQQNESDRAKQMTIHCILSNDEASELFLVVLLAASAVFWSKDCFVTGASTKYFEELVCFPNERTTYPGARYHELSSSRVYKAIRPFDLLMIIDASEDWDLLQMLACLTDNIAHRMAANAMSKSNRSSIKQGRPKTIVSALMQRLCDSTITPRSKMVEYPQILGRSIIQLIRTLILQQWDREPIIQRTSPIGGALELLSGLYRQRIELGLNEPSFIMPFVANAFDEMEMPLKWMSFLPNGRNMHILTFAFLFDPATLVKYFRAINIETMRKSHEDATKLLNDARQFLSSVTIPVYGSKEVLTELRPYLADYFVLTIRRTNVLDDAINQIWRRQRRELMRPLRVRIGKDEGEHGLDHGGVQQEFFRLAFAEALRPEYGMFSVDSRTQMTWFQPGSLEPLYKFEAMGILMSLAIYNGVTLPVTFPLAFYRKLLNLKVKTLEHINDGWPDLAKGLQILLDWSEGDVGDIIARTYEFSYDFAGENVTVDMQKVGRDDSWPQVQRMSKKGKEKVKSTSFDLPVPHDITPPSHSPPILSPEPVRSTSRTSSFRGITTPMSIESDILDEAITVTNENREQYVRDYVFWLTDKSIRPQYTAFAKGFFTCLDATALSLFSPEALRDVIEGHRDIDIAELKATTTYEEYDETSQTIIDFWDIVWDFSPRQHQQLLEFVTASDRIPVNGISSIQFIVQKNGDDDTRLPSSSTCYGRLLLPQYSTKAIMKEKLIKAIENSIGFGAL